MILFAWPALLIAAVLLADGGITQQGWTTAGTILASVCAGWGAAWLNNRTQKQQAKEVGAAAAFEGFNNLVENYREEVGRVQEQVTAAARNLAECESRCRDCTTTVRKLISDLAGLQAIVSDEVARAAVQTRLDELDAREQASEAAEIRKSMFGRDDPKGGGL